MVYRNSIQLPAEPCYDSRGAVHRISCSGRLEPVRAEPGTDPGSYRGSGRAHRRCRDKALRGSGVEYCSYPAGPRPDHPDPRFPDRGQAIRISGVEYCPYPAGPRADLPDPRFPDRNQVVARPLPEPTALTSTVVLSGYHSGPRWLMALAVCPAEMFGVFDAGIG